jgi:hypothetical protein
MLPTMVEAAMSVALRILAMLALSAAAVDRALLGVPPLWIAEYRGLRNTRKRHATSESPLLLVAIGGSLRAHGLADKSSGRTAAGR